MRALVTCSLLALATGCPTNRDTGGPPAQAGVGCPSAAGVYLASYLVPEEGTRGHTGWVLPLHDRVVDSLEGVPTYARIDAAAARAAGVPDPPPQVWLLQPGGPPCKATLGAHYAVPIDAPTKNIAYGVELSGCAAPPADAHDASTLALVSGPPPSQCELVPPEPVAARLGEVDATGRWSRPTKATPIPPELTPVLPARECPAASCEQLWSIARVDVAGKPVAWGALVNWLEVPAAPEPGPGGSAPAPATREAQCAWKAETFGDIFVAGPDGAPAPLPAGEDRGMLLTGVLADGGGAKVLVAARPGTYATYDLAGGRATVGRRLVWLVPDPGALAGLERLGPICP